jgi:hypothetical protein
MLHIFLLIAVFFHLWQAYSLQFVLEGDESVVLYWGGRFWEEGWSGFFSSKDVALWETPAAWLFGGFEWWTGLSARWLALVLSWLSLFLWYKILKTRIPPNQAILGVFLLATSPYYTFFSLSLGPLNIYWILSLYFWAYENHWAWLRMLSLLAGLFFYVYFRIVWLFDFLKSFVSHDLRALSRAALIAFLYFSILHLSGEMQWVAKKGGYLLERGLDYAVIQYIQSVLIWITPAWKQLNFFRQHSFLDLGRALVDLVFPDTVLGLTHSLLLISGIVFLFKNKSDRSLIPRWAMGLALSTFILAGWSATLVHLTALAPLFLFFMLPAISRVIIHSRLFMLVCVGALGSLLHFSISLWQQKTPVLSPAGDLVFKKWQEMTLNGSASTMPRLMVLVGNDYFFMRYYQQKWKRYSPHLPTWDIDFYSSQDREDFIVEVENLSRLGYTHLAIIRPQPIPNVPNVIRGISSKSEQDYQKMRFDIDYRAPHLSWVTLVDRSGRPQVDWLELQ